MLPWFMQAYPAFLNPKALTGNILRCQSSTRRSSAPSLQPTPKTVVVLANGAPVTMPWINQVSSVLEGYLGGQASGSGLADILMGHENPSGKLAETFPHVAERRAIYSVVSGRTAPDAISRKHLHRLSLLRHRWA